MKLAARSICHVLFLIFCIPSLLFAADDPPKDPFYTQGVSKDAPPINTVSEHVDPFSGILTLSHTDVHLPGNGGLDINLVRTYNSMIWGRRDVGNPGLVALNEHSPLGIGWSMHMGIVRNPYGTGSSNRYLPNNPVVEMPDGSRHTFYRDKNDGTRFISKEFWVYKVGNGIAELTLTDGTVYTFDLNAGYTINNGGVLETIVQATKIQNAARTSTITITYFSTNGYSYLKSITDSDSRTVTLNYDYPNNRLTSINVDNRTFNYSYTSIGGSSFLQAFSPPVGNDWTYEYESAYELSAINFPTGGKISYTYGDVSFATGSTRVNFRVVTGRATSGRDINGGTWTYTYNSGNTSGDTTTISAPGVTETHKFYGWGNTGTGNVWKVGLPMSKTFTGGFSLSESYAWAQGSQISNDQISNANWNGTIGQVYDTVIFVPFQTSKSVTRDGKTYTTNFSGYDYHGNPGAVSESGDISRTRSLSYWKNESKNIVADKPSSESITGGFSGTSSTSRTYDSNSGNVTQISNNGVTTSYGYDYDGNLSSITDANNHQKSYLWTNGMVSRATNPLYYISRAVNSDGTIGSETNGRGYTTSYSYDDNLRLTGITPPASNPTSISYPSDSSTRSESRGGYSITHEFDGFGRPTGSTDSRGVTTTIAYNAYGVKDYSDSNISDKVYYDYFGREKKILHKDNSAITYSYSGSNTTVTDENSKTITYTYSAFGNPDEKYLVAVNDQAGNTTTYSRNIQGLLTEITQGSVSRFYSYNSKFCLSSENNPETGTINYSRDDVGNMTGKSDSAGSKYYSYDVLDRLTAVSSGSGSINYDYDDADQRTSMSSPSASMIYAYDGANRLLTKSESIAGRSYGTAYEYDGNDNITEVSYPSGRVVGYGYNANNQVTSITGFGGSVQSVTYNTAGLPTSYVLSNGINASLSYNNRNQTTAIASGSAVNVGYSYDSRGNTTAMSNNIDASKSQSYGYDALSRLTGFNGAWGSGSFAYSAVGNRTSKTVAGTTTSYSYSSNRMSSASGGEPGTYTYNGNGALSGGTWQGTSYTLSYDGFDNLQGVDSGSTSLADFGYDGDGMRVYKTGDGKSTVYHYDQGGKIISEDDGSGTLLADYVYLNGKLIAKVAEDPGEAPAAPTGLTATAASPSGINLSWTDNSSNETGFAIERKTGASGTYAQVGTTGANATSFSDTGLSANTTYYYRVKALNASASSSYSNETNATTQQVGALAAPTSLTATAASSSAINILWTDNSTDETGFSIERKTGASGTYGQVATVNANVKSYSSTGLTANTTYYYRVRAINGSIYSAYSNEAHSTTQNPPPPTAPTGLTATAASSSVINLSWTDNSTDETGFSIERKTGASGTYGQIVTVGANVKSYSSTGLASSTIYYYRIRAMNGSAYSAYSNEAYAQTQQPNPPAAPSNLTVIAPTGSLTIALSWTDNSSNESGFNIERCDMTGTSCTYKKVGSTGASVTSFSDLSAQGGRCFYRVNAYNATGDTSAYSNSASYTGSDSAPTNLTATQQAGNNVTLTWKDNSINESGFKIERWKYKDAGYYQLIGTVSSNTITFTDPNLPVGTYFYQVHAYNNSGGRSANSNGASITIR